MTNQIHPVTSPSPLISVQEARDELRISHGSFDTLLNSYIATASSEINGFNTVTGRVFGEGTWVAYLTTPEYPITLGCAGVDEITKVSTREGISTWVDLDLDDLTIVKDPDATYIKHTAGDSLPWIDNKMPNVKIEFSTNTPIPELVKTIVKIRVRQLWNESPDPTLEAAWEKAVFNVSSRGC